jgi:hypothetical protein
MTRLSYVERCAGRPADYKVFYRRNGKLYFDAIWASNAVEAREQFLGFAKELGWRIDGIVRIESVPR